MGCGKEPSANLLVTQPAVRGPFVDAIEASGVIEPLAEVEIQTRISAKLARILDDGTPVQPGDVVAELESDRIRSYLSDNEARLLVGKAEVKRQTAYADMRIDSARYALQIAKANAEVARAEFANAKAGVLTPEETKIRAAAAVKESEIDRKDEQHKLSVASELQRMGVEDRVMFERQRVQKELADIDAKQAKVEFDDVMQGQTEEELREAELKLALAEHKLRAAQKALDERIKSKETTIASYLRRTKRYERYVQRYTKQLAQTVIKAPSRGVVMVKGMWGRKLVPGRYVYRSQPIASLPDLSRLKVGLWISEHDASKVRAGQKAQIRFATYPGRVFPGQVHKVAHLVKEVANDLTDRERRHVPAGVERVISVDVQISPTDVSLKCGVSASVRILTREKADALHIPKIALRSKRRVFFAIDPKEAAHVAQGQVVEVSSPDVPDAVCRGVVSKLGRWSGDGEVEPLASPDAMPTAAQVELDEVDERIRPGAPIVVSVAVSQPEPRHYFPKKKRRLDEFHYVIVRHGEQDEMRRVTVGLTTPYRAEIASGLEAGEAVVLEGAAP